MLINKKRKRISHLVDYCVPVNYRVKIKESQKLDKYLDLARELKTRIMKITVIPIPIVVGVLGMALGGIENKKKN